ncbi:hypothetical protein VP01_339g7 [Puccinia sorghi]|uniref:Tet-like 2OG-Fe(II) oxygenase domain-containing protein n=1 Tax=Puccinia sorghi TaxID=27349 RepID=A0A0L6UYJ5_9BASI|nr:hypothetical protein VP01_339g7 [Puccinia sorghi]
MNAKDIVGDPKVFKLFNHGKVVVLDHHQRAQILAIIEFKPINQLSPKEKEDLKFLSDFFHSSKEVLKPFKSCGQSWGGKMWAMGWWKAMSAAELIERYIFQLASLQYLGLNVKQTTSHHFPIYHSIPPFLNTIAHLTSSSHPMGSSLSHIVIKKATPILPLHYFSQSSKW